MVLKAAFNQGKFPTIVLVNKATVPLGVDFLKMASALQVFLDTKFVPIWGYPAKLVTGTKTPKGQWSMIFLDDADQANTLGYHDLTLLGQPISKVFVKDTLANGQRVSVTACHELCEMLIDPGAQLWAQAGNDVLYAYEMCDACESEEFLIEKIAMSDFVFPSFFESWHIPGSVQFDFLKKINQPFQTLKNGYQIIMSAGKVQYVYGSAAKKIGLQREDRRLHRSGYRGAYLPPFDSNVGGS
jgi:hypothetical protein